MGIDEIEAAWNAKADMFNQWHELGLDEIVEFAQEEEREACAKTAEDFNTFPHALSVVGGRIATEIRKRSNADITGSGKKKAKKFKP